MLWKFLIIGLLPALIGVLTGLGLCAWTWDRIFGLPSNGVPMSKLQGKLDAMTESIKKFEKANDTATGALLSYAVSKSAKQKELADKSLSEMSVLSKVLKERSSSAYLSTWSPLGDIAENAADAMKTATQFEQAVEQNQKPEIISAFADKLAAAMHKLTRNQMSIIANGSISLITSFVFEATVYVLVGLVAYLISSLVTIAAFTWSCRARSKKVEENLKNLAEGKELNKPVKGGDSISNIDRQLHQVAERLTAKSL